MADWRMAFRVGTGGQELWPECFRRGVAAITYWPLRRKDLSKYPKHEPAKLWAKLKPTQKASLSRVAYEMAKGDVIYVKQGPMIVGKGIVQSPYHYDKDLDLKDEDGNPWPHQVRVKWESSFRPMRRLFGGEQVTVRPISFRKSGGFTKRASPAAGDNELDEEMAAFEGERRRLFITHRKRERRLREAKLSVFRRDHRGQLYCEVPGCGFDFGDMYGGIGVGYAQVHHRRSLAKARGARTTTLDDLAVVCANCHAMIHRGGACRSLDSIAEALRRRRGRITS